MKENFKISTIHWEITPQCNYSCIHCYNFWRHVRDDVSLVDLNEVNYNLIIDKILDIKPKKVVITGGEPLLEYDKIKPGIKKLSSAGIDISINTNASLIDQEMASFFADYGVSILVSLPCSIPEINDSITNTDNSFLMTTRGIKLAKKYNVCIGINMVISNINKDFVIETASYVVNELGVKNFFVTKVGKPLDSKDFHKYEISMETFKKISDNLVDIKSQFDMEVGNLIAYPYCSFTQSDFSVIFEKRICTAGKTSLAIGADGSVRACVRVDKTYGNLFEDSIKTSWNRMYEWRDGTLLPKECKKCKNADYCNGGCRAEAYSVNGTLNALDPCADLSNSAFIESREIYEKNPCNCCVACVCFDLLSLWNTIYPFLDQVGTVLGIVGTSVGFGIWVKKSIPDIIYLSFSVIISHPSIQLMNVSAYAYTFSIFKHPVAIITDIFISPLNSNFSV